MLGAPQAPQAPHSAYLHMYSIPPFLPQITQLQGLTSLLVTIAAAWILVPLSTFSRVHLRLSGHWSRPQKPRKKDRREGNLIITESTWVNPRPCGVLMKFRVQLDPGKLKQRPLSISRTRLLPINRRVLFLLSSFSPPSFLPSSSWFKKDMAKEEKYQDQKHRPIHHI